jgi:hypothetical protein
VGRRAAALPDPQRDRVSGNEPPREMGQLYEVWREGETLRVRLQIRRSHSVDAALEFTAQRQ